MIRGESCGRKFSDMPDGGIVSTGVDGTASREIAPAPTLPTPTGGSPSTWSELTEQAGDLNNRAQILHSDTDDLHIDVIIREWQSRSTDFVRQDMPTRCFRSLADLGFSCASHSATDRRKCASSSKVATRASCDRSESFQCCRDPSGERSHRRALPGPRCRLLVRGTYRLGIPNNGHRPVCFEEATSWSFVWQRASLTRSRSYPLSTQIGVRSPAVTSKSSKARTVDSAIRAKDR